ncbi:MAG: CHAD domain-containing protein [Pseudomonadota bacterium]
MAYSYQTNETVETGTRRILSEQVARASNHLSAPTDLETSVHEARKAMKRARAALRLVGPVINPKKALKLDAQLCGVGRLLSQTRDFDVMVATLGNLDKAVADRRVLPRVARQPIQSALAKTISYVRETSMLPAGGATGRGSAEPGPAPADVLTHALERLAIARRLVDDIELPQTSIAVAIRPGLKKTYKAGRHCKNRAEQPTRDEDWHTWRKHTQAHWRHMALLRKAWPDWFLARLSVARQISQYLGQDHDLYVLKCHLAAMPKGTLAARGRKQLTAFIEIEQAAHRTHALRLGHLLYARSAKDFVGEVTAYWKQTEAIAQSMATLKGAASGNRAASGKTATNSRANGLQPCGSQPSA